MILAKYFIVFCLGIGLHSAYVGSFQLPKTTPDSEPMPKINIVDGATQVMLKSIKEDLMSSQPPSSSSEIVCQDNKEMPDMFEQALLNSTEKYDSWSLVGIFDVDRASLDVDSLQDLMPTLTFDQAVNIEQLNADGLLHDWMLNFLLKRPNTGDEKRNSLYSVLDRVNQSHPASGFIYHFDSLLQSECGGMINNTHFTDFIEKHSQQLSQSYIKRDFSSTRQLILNEGLCNYL